MAANASGISGSQIFRTSDAPLYRHALTAVCALAGVAWVLVLALNLQSWYFQLKQRKGLEEADASETTSPAESEPEK